MSRFSAVGPGTNKYRHSIAISGDPGKLLAAAGDTSGFKRTGYAAEHNASIDTGKLIGTGLEKGTAPKGSKTDEEQPDVENVEEVQLRYSPMELRARLQRRSIDLRRRSRRSVTPSAASWTIVDEGLDVLAKAFVKGTEPILVPEWDGDNDAPENQYESTGLTPYKLMMENFQEIERRVLEYSDGALHILHEMPDVEWEAGLKEPGRRFILRSKDKTKYQRIYVPPQGFKVCVSAVHQAQGEIAKVESNASSSNNASFLRSSKKKSIFF